MWEFFKERKNGDFKEGPENLQKLKNQTLEGYSGLTSAHHIIPISLVKDVFSIAVKQDKDSKGSTKFGIDLVKEWSKTAGASEKEIQMIETAIEENRPLDRITFEGDGIMPDGLKKVFWSPFNLVIGPKDDVRIDDPGNENLDVFSGPDHDDDLRKVSTALSQMYNIFLAIMKRRKITQEQSNEVVTKLISISEIVKGKGDFAAFGFNKNWKQDEISNQKKKWAKASTIGIENAREGKFEMIVADTHFVIEKKK